MKHECKEVCSMWSRHIVGERDAVGICRAPEFGANNTMVFFSNSALERILVLS
jgi:hypothetical protein